MAKVQGTCDAKFTEVQSLLQKFIDEGEEVGASIAVNIDGQEVVDIWGGYTDKERTSPWERDTIVNVYSSTKTVLSLATLMLVDRGLLDVDENVAKYWPEFAANGKEELKVRHLLSHTSGLPGWEEPLTKEDLFDFEKASSALAQQKPWFTPGSASGYQAMTMGSLLGELLRRVTDTNFKDFVANEIAGPLGADFQVGALEKDWPRITNVIPPEGHSLEGQPGEFAIKTFSNPAMDAFTSHTPEWRNAEIGAANGHSNARGMMRALSVISLGGEANGKRLLSQKTLDLIFKEQSNGTDLVINVPVRYGIGFGLNGSEIVNHFIPEDGRICFWGGWGGSIIIMDLDRRMTITYAMNKMGAGLVGNKTSVEYVKAIYAIVNKQ